ncbi:MAG: T9SS type A sorting domain-containing protein [Bacteroidota bacterium]|nr:T9SS type A sorting domain-containing protein [Bacteroidota bacterium]
MKLIYSLIFVLITGSANAFIQVYMHILPDYNGCSGKIEFYTCTQGGFTYTLNYDGNPILMNDPSLAAVCNGTHNFSFSATDGVATYGFEANINFNPNSAGISYVVQPAVLPLSVIRTYAISNNTCNGEINLAIDGGYSPTNLTWYQNGSPMTGASGTSLSNLCPGSYAYSISDAASFCSGMGNPPLIQITIDMLDCFINAENVTCNGACDGEAELIFTNNPAHILITDLTGPSSSSSLFIDNQCPGQVTGLIVHMTGTSAMCYSAIQEPLLLEPNLTVTNSAASASNGSASLTVTGGTAPYVVNWSTGSTDPNSLINLNQGNYSVTITDNNGCDSTIAFTIIEDPISSIVSYKKDKQISVYPNPTKDVVFIEGIDVKSIFLYDINNRQIRISTINSAGGTYINLSNIAQGVYIFKVDINNSLHVVRIIKE